VDGRPRNCALCRSPAWWKPARETDQRARRPETTSIDRVRRRKQDSYAKYQRRRKITRLWDDAEKLGLGLALDGEELKRRPMRRTEPSMRIVDDYSPVIVLRRVAAAARPVIPVRQRLPPIPPVGMLTPPPPRWDD
jgi:hypothetical protein